MHETEGYVVMDYEGEPCMIVDGVMYDVFPPHSKYYDGWSKDTDYMTWNSEKLEWEEPNAEECYGNDAKLTFAKFSTL